MKTCSKCRKPKLFEEFGPDKRASDRLQSQCRDCIKTWKLENAEKLKTADRFWYEANAKSIRQVKLTAYYADRERKNAVSKKWKQDNRSQVTEYWQQYARKNASRIVAYRRTYYAENRELYLAHAQARRAACAQATPPWFDEDMTWAVRQAYQLAALRQKMLGGKWHVDHQVPLRGKDVCGLHVPWNLQVIPASENIRKYNKFTDGQHLLPVIWG
jgi:hypothetical protein